MANRNWLVPIAAMAAIVPAMAQVGDPAATRIGGYNDAVIGVMKARLALGARADRFESIVRDYYDMPAIAALVVGPAWAGSSAADRTAAIAALTRHSALTLARNFKTYGGERFTVGPRVTDRGTSRVVQVTIASTGTPDTLYYQMRPAAGSWKIVDVVSGGVSQLAVQRADMAGAVASGGAAGLARRLAQVDKVAG